MKRTDTDTAAVTDAQIEAWFSLEHPCGTCPFRVGTPMRLSERTLTRVTEDLQDGTPFGCHGTTSEKGRSMNHPDARYCAGALRYAVHIGRPGNHMLLARRLGLWDWTRLHERVPVFTSEEALRAHHLGETPPGEP